MEKQGLRAQEDELKMCNLGGCEKEEGRERNLRLGRLGSAKANLPSPSHEPQLPKSTNDYRIGSVGVGQ